MAEAFILLLLTVVVGIPMYWLLVGINHLFLLWKNKRTPECECPLPDPYTRKVNFGDLFVCPECAWVYMYDWDDFGSGWCWLTWYVHLRYKLGWYPEERMLEPDPPPTIGRSVESNLQKRARLIARALRQAVRK